MIALRLGLSTCPGAMSADPAIERTPAAPTRREMMRLATYTHQYSSIIVKVHTAGSYRLTYSQNQLDQSFF